LLLFILPKSRWSCKILFLAFVGIAFASWRSCRGKGFHLEREQVKKKKILKKTKKATEYKELGSRKTINNLVN
jgi:hypothetical protein